MAEEKTTEWDRVTLSGKLAQDHVGPAPQPIDPATGMHADYWVLPEEERAKGFIRPYRDTYTHKDCGTPTKMAREIAETYARNPRYYSATYCCHCRAHFPVQQFEWADGSPVGS